MSMRLTEREKEVLEEIPADEWVNQFQLKTSKIVLSNLTRARKIKAKVVPNPTRDPRKGIVYQRVV